MGARGFGELIALPCSHLVLLWCVMRSRHWTPVTGTIQAVVPESGVITAQVQVMYEYQVLGQFYGGSYWKRVFRSEVRRVEQLFPPRSSALVHYDPARPDRSFLVKAQEG